MNNLEQYCSNCRGRFTCAARDSQQLGYENVNKLLRKENGWTDQSFAGVVQQAVNEATSIGCPDNEAREAVAQVLDRVIQNAGWLNGVSKQAEQVVAKFREDTRKAVASK